LIADLDCSPEKIAGDFAEIVRLGQGVDQSRELHPDAMERTLRVLRDYSARVKAAGLDPAQTSAAATATARDARNGAEFFARVERETGFKFRILSGDEEARITFLGGLLPGMELRKSAVIDIGGGSTELIASPEGKPFGQSLNMGSVRFTERFLKSDPVTDPEFWACQEEIDRTLESLLPWRAKISRETQLVAVAGTATTLAAYFLELPKFDFDRVNQVTLSRGDLHRMVEELKWRSVAEREKIAGIEKGRSDVILAGALILWRALEVLKFPEVRVSTRGIRYGLLK
jgi:exopolyphosphatase/guanosine-5'-triphosphate,3'-diphosphate pyrophosphatase